MESIKLLSPRIALALLLSLCSPHFLSGQMHDNTWVIGYQGGTSEEYGLSILTFRDGSLNIDTMSVFWSGFEGNNSAFSDAEGRFFAFFNGVDIRDASFGFMENGSGLDVEIVPSDLYLSKEILPQGSIFLPYPGHPDSVLLLYQGWGILSLPNGLIDVASLDLSFATIDAKANGGLGKVVRYDLSFIHDTIQYGRLTAVKHANGRDWWMLVQERNTNRFYTVLIDPNGVHQLGTQSVDFPIPDGVGNSVFSPDGERFATYNSVSADLGGWVDVFDFDRCTGGLSNQRQLHMGNGVGFVAFSPNSRFLYQAALDTAYRYDLADPDIWPSQEVLAVYDGFVAPFPVFFYQLRLAPDGKIYGSAPNGTNHLHVIERPDEADCGFRQHGLELIKYNSFSVPNFPHYRLGPLDGSTCDTLGLDNWPKAWYRHERDTLDDRNVYFHDLSYYEPASWAWDFGDGSPVVAGERHPVHRFDSAGVYKVCLTVDNTNGTDTHCKTLYIGTTAQESPSPGKEAVVFPNPLRGGQGLSLASPVGGATFYLFNQLGNLVLKKEIRAGMNEVGGLGIPPGVYFWELRHKNMKTEAGRVVKVE